MYIQNKKGFTLIELLVVIAIIGILSSVVLASLNTARDKAKDAAIKSSMQTIRVQAELYYDDNSNAYGVATDCSTALTMFNHAAIASAAPIALAITEINNQSSGSATCDATGGQAWAVSAPLVAGASPGHWCTDSTGRALEKTAALVGNTDCSY